MPGPLYTKSQDHARTGPSRAPRPFPEWPCQGTMTDPGMVTPGYHHHSRIGLAQLPLPGTCAPCMCQAHIRHSKHSGDTLVQFQAQQGAQPAPTTPSCRGGHDRSRNGYPAYHDRSRNGPSPVPRPFPEWPSQGTRTVPGMALPGYHDRSRNGLARVPRPFPEWPCQGTRTVPGMAPPGYHDHSRARTAPALLSRPCPDWSSLVPGSSPERSCTGTFMPGMACEYMNWRAHAANICISYSNSTCYISWFQVLMQERMHAMMDVRLCIHSFTCPFLHCFT